MPTDWEAHYRDVYGDLVRYLYRKVWDAHRAEDLAQETFVRALGHDPDRPRAFLFTVAANLARDEARTAARRRKHLTLLKAEAEEDDPAMTDTAATAERAEETERVKAALDGLSDRDREVLLLWDAGWSYQEIADQTGLSPGAIGTTLSRARARLVAEYESLEQRDAAPN